MAMRRQNGYGKRQTAEQRLAAQMFTSSSPVKPLQNDISVIDSPSRNTRGALRRLEKQEDIVSLSIEYDGELEILANDLDSLQLASTDNGPLTSANDRLEPVSIEAVTLALREINVNQEAKQSARGKRAKSLKTVPLDPLIMQGPARTTNTATHTRFDDEGCILTVSKTAESSQPKRSQSTRQVKAAPKSMPSNASLFNDYAKPLLSLCSDPKGRSEVGSFQIWSDSVDKYLDIIKIAEASYGEVYRLSFSSSNAKSGLTTADESVLKLIALKPPPSNVPLSPHDEERIAAMSDLMDVTNEAKVLRHMSPVPGFTNFRDVRVLRGRLPTQFITAWKRYNKHVKKSLFPDPSRKASYSDDQLWAVVEMQDAGTDVETLQERGLQIGVFAAWDIFWGVAGAVAKGEEWAEFEHRDLHMGNICIKPVGEERENWLKPKYERLRTERSLNYTNIETTLIDYTLSRAVIDTAVLPLPTKSIGAAGAADEGIAFFDLSKDEAIFAGDASEEYQYEIYRYMRSAVLFDDPARKKAAAKGRSKKTGGAEIDAWRGSCRLTNLVWLHFVLHKLLEAVAWADDVGSDESREKEEEEEVDEEVKRLGARLRRRLEKVRRLLNIDKLAAGSLKSGGDLVLLAMERGWLREEDVLGVAGDDDAASLEQQMTEMRL